MDFTEEQLFLPKGCMKRLLRLLELGNILVNYLKLSFTVPQYFFAEDMETADFTIFPCDAYFVFGRAIIASFSFSLSYLDLGKALRCIELQ